MTAGIEPRVAADYLPSCGRLVRQACVEVAIRLVDFRDEICLVPSLIVDQLDLADDAEAHIGTIDLDLAFEDFETILLRKTLPGRRGEAERAVKVCGPGAFTVLKALAFDRRGKPKDAYDLFYVLRNHPARVRGIAEKLRLFGDRPEVIEAVSILDRDFRSGGEVGPTSVIEFLGREDDALRADVAGFVRDLLDALNW